MRAAYSGALGNALIPEAHDLEALTPAALADFVAENYTAPRIALAGAGVEHRALVALAEPMLGGLPAVKAAPEPESQYRGAHVYLPGTAPEANIILGFEYAGGWRDVQGAATMVVLTHLLGGGSSFSSGGPGKGMHSRLYTRVLNQHGWATQCLAFSDCFASSGLVGIQAACEPAYTQQMLDVMCSGAPRARARGLGLDGSHSAAAVTASLSEPSACPRSRPPAPASHACCSRSSPAPAPLPLTAAHRPPNRRQQSWRR